MGAFSDIRSAIGTKIGSMAWAGNPIAFAYDYHKLGVEWYPAASFEPSSIASAITTTSANYRTYAFDIVVQQEISVMSRGDAIASLVDITDALVDAFDSDFTLWGACDMVEAVPAEFWELAAEDSVLLYSRVTLRCWTLVNIP